MSIDIEKNSFGQLKNGTQIDLFTMTNSNGVIVKITNYGGIVTELHAPDRNRKSANIALGFPTLDGYLTNHPYFGAIIGRYANRIAGGAFELDGKRYKLFKNNGSNTLHGGKKGFDKHLWQAGMSGTADSVFLELSYTSFDGEEGFPGVLNCTVVYSLNNNNELQIDYEAKTDKPTPVNLTHHSYFNLSGVGNGDILNHEIQIDADKYTPVNQSLIPTGDLANVEKTPFDLRISTPIGARIADSGGGYDHNFVLNGEPGKLHMGARVVDAHSGRVLELRTTEPGLQFYSGNFLDGTVKGNGGAYEKHYGFALEAQHFPNSVNQPEFPNVILRPGEIYNQTTIYKFDVLNDR